MLLTRGSPAFDGLRIFRSQQHGGVFLKSGRGKFVPFRSPFLHIGAGIEFDIALTDAGENSLQRVIIFLGDWIEFVRVTPGAIRRRAGEGGHRLGDDVVTVEIIECDRRCSGAAEFQGPRRDKSQTSR